ncbi:ESPR domain-containing protein [Anaeroglobus geminatus]
MNRIFKVIYNRTCNMYQVVSELTKNHGRTAS